MYFGEAAQLEFCTPSKFFDFDWKGSTKRYRSRFFPLQASKTDPFIFSISLHTRRTRNLMGRKQRSATIIPEPFSQRPVQHDCIEGRPRKMRFKNPLGLPAPLTWHQVSLSLNSYEEERCSFNKSERRIEDCSMIRNERGKADFLVISSVVLLYLCDTRLRSCLYRWSCELRSRVSFHFRRFLKTPLMRKLNFHDYFRCA